MERCTPPNPQGYAGRYAPLHPTLPFLCEKREGKGTFKGGRTARDTIEVRPPLKIPLPLGVVISFTIFQNKLPFVEGEF